MPQHLPVHPLSQEALTTQRQNSMKALRLATLLPEA